MGLMALFFLVQFASFRLHDRSLAWIKGLEISQVETNLFTMLSTLGSALIDAYFQVLIVVTLALIYQQLVQQEM